MEVEGAKIKLTDGERLSFLKDEYLLLQNQYEDFDRRSLTIKGWVASGAGAALAISFNTTYRLAVCLPLFVALMAVVFWYLEAKWKVFQYSLADRIRTIEAFFRDDPDKPDSNPAPFQIYHAWYKSYAEDKPLFPYEKDHRPRTLARRLKNAALHPYVSALYIVVLAASLFSVFALALFPT